MTVTTTHRQRDHATNGVQTIFDADFPALSTDHVKAIPVIAGVEGAEITTGFTKAFLPGTKNVRFTFAAAPSGFTLRQKRVTPKTQEATLRNRSTNPAETYEGALDRLTMLAQEPEPGPKGDKGDQGDPGGPPGPAGPTGPGVPTGGTAGQRLRKKSGSNYDTEWVDDVRSFQIVLDGGGAVLTTGLKAVLEIPDACEITAARLFADQTGSIVVDIFKTTYAAYDPPTTPASGGKITASAPPTIAGAKKSQDATLTGWAKTLAAGDVLGFNINSVATIQRVTLSLTVRRL